MEIINENDEVYIYSPSLHQDLYHKLINNFSNYIPIHIITKFLNEEVIDVVIDEIVDNKDFQKSDTEIEAFDNLEELNYAQEYKNKRNIKRDNLNEKEIKNDKIQAMFKRGHHNNFPIFIISQDYYELPKGTIRANENIYQIFKPNIFLDVRNVYQAENEYGHDTR